MEVKNKTVLVLGGAGLVGTAVCRELLPLNPRKLIISSLAASEVAEATSLLKKNFPDTAAEFAGIHGNLFVRSALKDAGRQEMLDDTGHRRAIIDDTLLPLTEEILDRSFLYQVLTEEKPDLVVDCVNTATALAYQDIFRSASEVLDHLDKGHGIETFRGTLERHLCTLYTPQLIRHIQILYEGLVKAGVGGYIKIGTSGTGGMGLNIPYTHSEEKPSRILLSKSAMAGAHTLLLFLMARTPGGPVVKEIKPAAAIAWKGIRYGEVIKRGKPIRLHDCPFDQPVDLNADPDMGGSRSYPEVDAGADGNLKSVYIDTGENGIFSRAEFEVVTTLGQMEFVTPEEIARNVRFEVAGINSGHDVINALDTASMDPTYRAGVMRATALKRLEALEKEHEVASVAFEMLGPPRLSKLLFEADLLRRIRVTFRGVAEDDPEKLAADAAGYIKDHQDFRTQILSIGIPVLLPDGSSLLRGPRMVIPTVWENKTLTPASLDRWSREGWVDLRVANMKKWQERFQGVLAEAGAMDPDDSSSRHDLPEEFRSPDNEIPIGKMVGWLFIREEQGQRMKA
ncbi:MAG: short-chain dehydrogenase [Acidobacteria bacterium]|uniref:Short-chain dehydrogenase n=1 Tax=Candidatus Polarisedimenticola svalbardensis TaxID=2886004 RepID=A0A8J6XU26_9BACT|nr:short-chain dehydrogenase [Candidatus Polarisedimenticola svalbardensis]